MKISEWAFVDLENIGSGLTNISIEKYNAIYVFVGSKQSSLALPPSFGEKLLEIKLLKIKESSKNNLDFHLSYYLGKLDFSAKKDICFTVISNDTGFDNLIEHINATGRKCQRLSIENKKKQVNKTTKQKSKQLTKEEEQASKQLILNLLKKDIEKLPKSEKALKNYIASKLGSNISEMTVATVYSSAVKYKTIANRIKLD